ncbi:dTDP-4-dehydrorhamnose reductase [Pseudanabaena sp. FACHB-2040]|uniref:dTDP-4-dehydrorhamnose reductase n=1 Tax=Pseudanabaena sp. FACHB-2040 TaxID=2692859 RepID=UPI0016851A7D|nr:dTDP-4-dehydrorhamnose reductase [Pseudanabaena sp. FACHB-2040]MBD2257264.1 dTDP-4-dehydrorhamnose reductase [Pseudanabaena sp. FACHB-2040]
MRIVLLGSQGQVGQELQRTLARQGELVCLSRQELDLTHLDHLVETVSSLQPQVVVNAAAYTAVDKAETEPELAHCINGTVPGLLAEAAKQCGAAMIHLSTDYVFNGTKNTPYEETDTTAPLGIYGHSKRTGEVAVLQATDRAIVLRTAWVYGAAPSAKNFVKTMLRVGPERGLVRVVVDQVGAPTWAYDIAATVSDLLAPVQSGQGGLYHFASSGVASWFDFAIAIFEEAQTLGLIETLPEVVPIPTSEYPLPAQRPAYSVLSSQKISQLLGRRPPYWRASLRKMLAELAAPP